MQAPPTRRPSRVPVAALVVVLAVVALALIGGFWLVPRAGPGRGGERPGPTRAPPPVAGQPGGRPAPAALSAFEPRRRGQRRCGSSWRSPPHQSSASSG